MKLYSDDKYSSLLVIKKLTLTKNINLTLIKKIYICAMAVMN